MADTEGYIVEGYEFAGKTEYEQAKREQETICNLERKMTLGDPKVALSLYNQAVSKKTFKTPVGYEFLKRLRDTIVSCGLVADDALNGIPIAPKVVKERTVKRDIAIEKKSKESVSDDSISRLYENEKKKRTILTVAVITLVAVIVAMFVITMSSKYSFLTYFTDYENNIREQVIDEYEEWENSLKEREQALENGLE